MALRFLILITLLWFLVPIGASHASEAPQERSTTVSEVIDAVNSTRFQAGLYPYQIDNILMVVAQSHSEFQASIHEMTHRGENDSTSTQRAENEDYGQGQLVQVNEMVYSGRFASASAAIEFWSSSEIHNAIMLSTDYHQFGVGVASDGDTTYITVNVGLVVGATAPQPLTQSTRYAPITVENTSFGAGGTIEPLGVPQTDGQALNNDGIESYPVRVQPEEDTPNLLMNLPFLWGIICLQSLGIAFLAYYIWRIRLGKIGMLSTDRSRKRSNTIGDFSEQSHTDQFDLLQEFAESVLQHYPLELSRISKLEYRLNATFLIEALHTDEPELGVQKYLLRVNSPGFQSKSTIESEMLWLAAIRRAGDLIVPEPLLNQERSPVTTLEGSAIPGSRHCTIVSWLEGTSPHQHLTEEILEEVGVFMGKLHQHAVGFKTPAGFERKNWDLEGFQTEMIDVPVTKIRRRLMKEQIDLIEEVVDKVKTSTGQLEHNSETFGLIHGNLHERNYLVYRGDIRAVDFDSCGWGYFGYDLAVTLSQLVSRPNFSQLRTALLKGYKQVRLIGTDIEQNLGTFIAARYVNNIMWLAGHEDEDIFRDEAPHLIEKYCTYLGRFLKRG